MEIEIQKEAKHSKDFWGFSCLKNACEFCWDIGEDVYFTSGEEVVKGTVISVNSRGVCGVRYVTNKDLIIYIHHTTLFTNAFYALKKAEYNSQQKTEVKSEVKDAEPYKDN